MDEWDNLCGRCFGKRLLKQGECCLIDEKQQQGSIVRALAVFFAIIMTVSYAGTGVIQMVDYKLNRSSDEVVGDELKRKWSVVSDGDESADMDQVYPAILR